MSESDSRIGINLKLVPVASTDINNSCGQLLYDLVFEYGPEIKENPESVSGLSISMIQWYIYEGDKVACPVGTDCCVDNCDTPVSNVNALIANVITNPTTKTGIITQATSPQYGAFAQGAIQEGLTMRIVISTSEHAYDPCAPNKDNIIVQVFFAGTYFNVNFTQTFNTTAISQPVPVYYPPYAPSVKTALIDDEDNTLYILCETFDPSKMCQFVAVVSYNKTTVTASSNKLVSYDKTNVTPGIYTSVPLDPWVCSPSGKCTDEYGRPVNICIYKIPDFTIVAPDEKNCGVTGFNVGQHDYILLDDNIYPTEHSFYSISAIADTACLGCEDLAPQITSLDYLVYKTNPCIPRCNEDCPRPDDQKVIVSWKQPCDYFIPPYADYYIIKIVGYQDGSQVFDVSENYIVPEDQRYCPVLHATVDLESEELGIMEYLKCGLKMEFTVTAHYTDDTESPESEDRYIYYFEYPEAPPLRIDNVAYDGPYGDEYASASFTWYNPLDKYLGCGRDPKNYKYYITTYDCKDPDGNVDENGDPVYEYYTVPYEAGPDPYNDEVTNINFSTYDNQAPLLFHIALYVRVPEQDKRLEINPIDPNMMVHGYPADADLLLTNITQLNFNRANNTLYLDFNSKVPAKSITIVKYNGENDEQHLPCVIPEPLLTNGQHEYSIHYDVGHYKPHNKKIGIIIEAPGLKSEKKWNWE
jgi:hypothetical protein